MCIMIYYNASINHWVRPKAMDVGVVDKKGTSGGVFPETEVFSCEDVDPIFPSPMIWLFASDLHASTWSPSALTCVINNLTL